MDNSKSCCSYCSEAIGEDDYLECNQCLKLFHIKCLKRPGTPGDLHGDVFFDFTCMRCSPLEEIFIRKKLPWVIVIVLAIYNLSIQSQGLSNKGYFHWRSHIASYIDKNWKYLFDVNTKQKKKWFGTISGVLSGYNPGFFDSAGSKNIRDSGWWKLSSKNSPKYFMQKFENLPKKQKVANINSNNDEIVSAKTECHQQSDASENENRNDYICSRMLPYMGRKRKRHFSEQSRASDSSVKLSLMNFLEENISHDGLLLESSQILSSPPHDDFTFNSNEISSFWPEQSTQTGNEVLLKEDNDFHPRIIQVTNYQQAEMKHDSKNNRNFASNENVEISHESVVSETSDSEQNDDDEMIECSKSLFTKTQKRSLPWLNRRSPVSLTINNLETLSEYEELKLYMSLKKIFDSEKYLEPKEIPSSIRLLYRKLSLRIWKRKNGLKPFELHEFMDRETETNTKQTNCILDRFSCLISDSIIHSMPTSKLNFLAQLSGTEHYELFESPFTSRILMPFIYRNVSYSPNWLKLMCEIKFSKFKEPNSELVERSTIDFCYVRPYHIAGVNSLLQQIFWPGIDMSECLSYPDFSVVALYKKLIIGCAFMVPDVTYNEAYISFMAVRPHWQHSGIGSFMLYHLTQTCMGKDITLHVSASNPAICLYQKFGFKIEEFVLDFYEKYLPLETNESRHAFFLRLKR